MASVLLSGCVSQSAYDQLQAQNQQLQQQNSALQAQVAADKAQLCRLQGAIKYTVNSDLLFPSGGWQILDRRHLGVVLHFQREQRLAVPVGRLADE